MPKKEIQPGSQILSSRSHRGYHDYGREGLNYILNWQPNIQLGCVIGVNSSKKMKELQGEGDLFPGSRYLLSLGNGG